MLSLKEELLLSRANIQLALFSILFTAAVAAVAAAYALSSPLSLSLLYTIESYKKSKEDKNHNSSSNKEEKQWIFDK